MKKTELPEKITITILYDSFIIDVIFVGNDTHKKY